MKLKSLIASVLFGSTPFAKAAYIFSKYKIRTLSRSALVMLLLVVSHPSVAALLYAATPNFTISFDTSTGQVVNMFSNLAGAKEIAFGPNGLLYAATPNYTISFDTSTGQVVNMFSNLAGANDIAFAPPPTLSEPAAPVPEPATYTMLLAGLGLLGFTTRRKKQNLS